MNLTNCLRSCHTSAPMNYENFACARECLHEACVEAQWMSNPMTLCLMISMCVGFLALHSLYQAHTNMQKSID